MSTLRQRLRFGLDHRWAPARMSAYLDGELGARGGARLERHVGGCAQCRQVLRELRELVDRLRALAPAREPAPAELVRAVRGRLRRAGG